MTKKEIKHIFNSLAKHNERNIKYKRAIKVTNETFLIEAVNLERCIFSSFYSFKLMYHSLYSNVSIFQGDISDLKQLKEYHKLFN
jgi:hypothetical protein